MARSTCVHMKLNRALNKVLLNELQSQIDHFYHYHSDMELVQFITRFFISKRVSLLTAFICWGQDETLNLWRSASLKGLKLRVYDGGIDGTSLPELPAYDTHREGILLDVACPYNCTLLNQASSSRAFIHRYTWLLLDKTSINISTIETVLDQIAILPDCDVTWSSIDATVDLYRVKSNQPPIVTELPVNRSYSLKAMELFWSRWTTAVTRRKNLGNVFINTGTIVSQPQHFKGWHDFTNRQIDTYPKVTYPLLMLLAEDLNFRHNMLQVDLYGEEYNGSFTGLAGLLQRERIEIGVASMFMRNDRWRVLHFVSETVGLTGAFIFRQPAQSSVSNVFLLPFSTGVWWAVGAVLVLTAFLLAAQARTLRLEALDLPEATTFAIGTICQQGFHMTPDHISIRVAMFSILVCSVFAFTAYSAKIVALLQTPSDAIQTIDQLTKSPLTLGVQETTYKRVYFAESTEPATQRLYRRKLLPLGDAAYLSVVDGVSRLRTGLFAFQVEQSPGYEIISKTFTEEEKCGLKEIQAFKLPMVAVPIRKHSGYRDLAAVRLRWQREVGLAGREKRRWMVERARCAAAAAGFRSVAIVDILPALQILGAGMSISVFLLLAEITLRCVVCGNLKAIRNWRTK